MNIFQEIALMNKQQEVNMLIEDRLLLREIVDFYKNQPWQEEYTRWFADLRKLKYETLINADCFMCDEDFSVYEIPIDLRADRLGFCYKDNLVYSGFFVLPVKDVKGNIMGFVGYNKTHLEDGTPKYLDSRTIGYSAKQTTFFGMENLPQFYEDGHVLITEGPMCKLFLTENNINAMSSLGSNLSPYCCEILKRFKDKGIIVTDNDLKGAMFARQIHYISPKTRVIHTINGKDIDDTRQIEPLLIEELKEFIVRPFKRYSTFRKL